MAQPEVVGALMPAVLGKWESLRDDERALIPCTECLSALVGALGPQFLPFVEPLYGRIMRLVHARTAALATPELEEPDFDWPCVSLDLLSAMLESFGPQMAPLLESSGGVALIVQAAGIEPETEMKRVRITPLKNGGDHSFGGRFGPLRNRPRVFWRRFLDS